MKPVVFAVGMKQGMKHGMKHGLSHGMNNGMLFSSLQHGMYISCDFKWLKHGFTIMGFSEVGFHENFSSHDFSWEFTPGADGIGMPKGPRGAPGPCWHQNPSPIYIYTYNHPGDR